MLILKKFSKPSLIHENTFIPKIDFSLLRYLHEVCLPSVVHKNLKSANILLDEEFNPRLSDCGLATLAPNTERQVSLLAKPLPLFGSLLFTFSLTPILNETS